MFVVAMVVGADLLRDDTGLITGLVIGAILANRPPRGIGPKGMEIQRAKLLSGWQERIGTLSTFLIGTLFIILSARVTPHQFAEIGWVSVAFIAVLVLIGRPLAVALSSLGSKLRWRERAFIAWMAPRGIVAAATSSTFALGLSQAGVGGGAQKLIPITFIVIVATALIYGLTGDPGARALGVASTGPGRVLLVGSSPVGRAIGHALKDRGLTVLLWTGNDEGARAPSGRERKNGHPHSPRRNRDADVHTHPREGPARPRRRRPAAAARRARAHRAGRAQLTPPSVETHEDVALALEAAGLRARFARAMSRPEPETAR